MALPSKHSSKPIITLDITSDFACPWCYVGYMRFNNALQAVQEKKKINILSVMKIHWYPYMIDMQTKKGGEPFLAYNQRRWGSDGWFTHGCKKEARKDGCKFAGFGRENPDSYWANTLNAHRFMWFFSANHKLKGGSSGLDILQSSFNLTQHELKATILKFYYERGVNISLTENLIKLAQELKMDDVKRTANIDFVAFLKDEQRGRKEVIAEDRKAKNSGISGVPYFKITADHSGIKKVVWEGSGARASKWWIQIIEQLVTQLK